MDTGLKQVGGHSAEDEAGRRRGQVGAGAREAPVLLTGVESGSGNLNSMAKGVQGPDSADPRARVREKSISLGPL